MVDPLNYFYFFDLYNFVIITSSIYLFLIGRRIYPSWWTHWASSISLTYITLLLLLVAFIYLRSVVGSILHGGPIELFLFFYLYNFVIITSSIYLFIYDGSSDQSFMVDPLSYFYFFDLYLYNFVIITSSIYLFTMGHRIDPSWWTHWTISISLTYITLLLLLVVFIYLFMMGHRIDPSWWTQLSYFYFFDLYNFVIITSSIYLFLIGRRIDPSWWTHWTISISLTYITLLLLLVVFVYLRWVVGSILHGVDPIELFLVPASCSMTGVTKAVVCAILSGMMHIKEPLLLIG